MVLVNCTQADALRTACARVRIHLTPESTERSRTRHGRADGRQTFDRVPCGPYSGRDAPWVQPVRRRSNRDTRKKAHRAIPDAVKIVAHIVGIWN